VRNYLEALKLLSTFNTNSANFLEFRAFSLISVALRGSTRPERGVLSCFRSASGREKAWMNSKLKNLFLAFLIGSVVVGAAAVEDWYGKFNYGGDAIAYLDIAKALRHGDWTLALNPYWSIGYPMILAATRWMFPSDPHGEWTAIHVVNLVIFVLSYASFLHFLKVASAYLGMVESTGATRAADSGDWFVFSLGTSLFLLLQLFIANVSRVSPDPSVGCIFFLMMATSLRFYMQPRVTTAVLLGLLMGFGYILKAILLPISAIVFLVALLQSLTRSPADRLSAVSRLAWALPAMALLALPYAAACFHARCIGQFKLRLECESFAVLGALAGRPVAAGRAAPSHPPAFEESSRLRVFRTAPGHLCPLV